ncbi:EVI5-like protein isoform X2 [Bolinopsis microptera]|uniref:EVI5-like protein isoform X2 n=1 Tax=Bolinopsis microptera TaxID=2820187 RepID=UPI00307918FC
MSEHCSLCTAGTLSEEHLVHLLREQNRQLEADTKCRTFNREDSEGSLRNEEAEAEELAVSWLEIMKRWDSNSRKKQKSQVEKLVYRGVPNDLRALIWMVLANDSNKSHLRLRYPELIEQTSPCEKLIRRDICRTYPEHKFFKEQGQEALFNVIKAYSLHDREVGYCQGSPFIVGILLLQMPEEEAFCVLVELMESYRMREFFKPSMKELSVNLYILSELIQEQIPELHLHFKAQGFHPTTYASQWFLTMFATVLPLNAVFRIMDIFLWEQTYDVIFQVGIALLKEGKDKLINMDIEGMLQYFRTTVYRNYVGAEDDLVQKLRQIKLDQKKLRRLKQVWTNEKERESLELEECKRLTFENSVLCQRIKTLEDETCHLADKLIKGQVSRAEQAEEMFILKRELVALRRHDGELNEKLKESTRKNCYIDAKLHGICGENEALRQALSSLGHDPMQFVQNVEMPNCVYSNTVKLPKLDSCQGREERCDAGYCTIGRQESSECNPGAMQVLAENTSSNQQSGGDKSTHARSISSDSVISSSSSEQANHNNSYYKNNMQTDSKLVISEGGSSLSSNSNKLSEGLKRTFGLSDKSSSSRVL